MPKTRMHRRAWSLRRQVTFGMVAMCVLVAVQAVVGLWLLFGISGNYQSAVGLQVPKVAALSSLMQHGTQIIEEALTVAYAKDSQIPEVQVLAKAEQEEIPEVHEHMHEAIDRLAHLSSGPADELLVQQLRADTDALYAACIEILDAPDDGERDAAVLIARLQQSIEGHRDQLFDRIDQSTQAVLVGLEQGHEQAVAQRALAFGVAILLSMGAVVLGLALGWPLIRRVQDALKTMQQAVGAYGQGHRQSRVPGLGLQEFDRIGVAFNETADALDLAVAARDEAHQAFNQAARQAGMAEVATGVLHNVGNVLNSVNLAAERLQKLIGNARAEHLTAVADLVNEQKDMAGFVTDDPRGQNLPKFLGNFAEHLATTMGQTQSELNGLSEKVEHIKQVVAVQQDHARLSLLIESVSVRELVEDSVRINEMSFHRHDIDLHMHLSDRLEAVTDRSKVLQVLVNLISNAKQAVKSCERPAGERCVTVRTETEGDMVCIVVEDNGMGIDAENMGRLFEHGFTTRPDGHGFGLHTCALIAKQLGGHIQAHSDGQGHGATFRFAFARDLKAFEAKDGRVGIKKDRTLGLAATQSIPPSDPTNDAVAPGQAA